MDELSALRLQLAWGADEALLDAPQDRRAAIAENAKPMGKPVAKLAAAMAGLPAGPAQAAAIAAGCTSLAALRAALAAFSGCALRDTATQLVFADGPDDARIVMVGEAPGAEEDRSGTPFTGPAGQLLDKMLASIQLDRSALRLTNTVPWRPPGDRAPSEAEIALCLPFLHQHIALVRPQILVLLGAVAAKAMLPQHVSNAGIRRLRGKFQTLSIPGMESDIACLPMYHPAYLLRMPAAKRDSWHDFLALQDWLEAKNIG